MIHNGFRGLFSSVALQVRIFALAVLVFLGSAIPSLAQHQIGHRVCCGRQDVILIRGGAGYWPGAQDMADHFQRLGYIPTVVFGVEYAVVADEIATAVSEGRIAGGVVIVGYSS